MIMNVEISSFDPAWKSLSPEKYQKARELFPEMSETQDASYVYGAKGLVDLDLLTELVDETGLNAILKPACKGSVFVRKSGFDERLRRLESSYHLIRGQSQGEVVQIHVPNFTMLTVNRVMVVENACTDELQQKLDLGWRILCVCPPLSERRPTYIMGRHEDQVANDLRDAAR